MIIVINTTKLPDDPKPEVIRILREYIKPLEADTRPGLPMGLLSDKDGKTVGRVY